MYLKTLFMIKIMLFLWLDFNKIKCIIYTVYIRNKNKNIIKYMYIKTMVYLQWNKTKSKLNVINK